MIEYIEEVGTDLQVHPLCDGRVLEDPQIEFLEAGAKKNIATQIAEMAAARLAIAIARAVKVRAVAECAWNLKRAQINEIVRSAPVLNGSDHVRSIESLTGAGIIPFEVVIERERLAVLQAGSAIQPPSALQFGKTPASRRKLVGEIPAETPANVKVGIAALRLWRKAVIRLGCVGNEVFEITGVVNRM